MLLLYLSNIILPTMLIVKHQNKFLVCGNLLANEADSAIKYYCDRVVFKK